MAGKVTLYMFTGSTPSITAQLMPEHKQIDYKRVHMLVGPHAFSMLGRGFQLMNVPALKIDGRRVQGSRQISRALEELQPQPPLFGADEHQRRAVAQAARWGEEFQDAVRRIFWCAARRNPRAMMTVHPHANPLMRPAQHVTRRLVTRLATAGHQASDFAGEEDLAELPAAQLARRLLPEGSVQIGAALPAKWLAAVGSSPSHGPDGTRYGPSP